MLRKEDRPLVGALLAIALALVLNWSTAPYPRTESIDGPHNFATEERSKWETPLGDLWNWIAKDSISFFTGVLAVLTGFVVLYNGRQIRLARDEFNTTHRPRLRIRGIQKEIGGMNIEVANVGESPATIIGAAVVFRRKLGLMWYPDRPNLMMISSPSRDESESPIGNGEVRAFYAAATIPGTAVNGSEVAVGIIQYADASGTKRRTGFCWPYVAVQQSFIHPRSADRETYDYEYNYED